MRQKALLRGLVYAMSMAALSGCNDDFTPGDNGVGSIAPDVAVCTDVVSARNSRAAEYADVTVSDLSLRLTKADGTYTKNWESVDDFPADGKFKIGDYTLEAFYGSAAVEGFEAPYFYGSTSLTVEEGKTTPVSLSAGLANSMVSIIYTDAFKSYMSSWSSEIHTAAGSYIDYSMTETRPAYIAPGATNILVSITKPNGLTAKLQAASFQAKAKYHYTVTIDLNEGAGSGDAAVTVTFDELLADAPPVVIDISDEVINAPAPTMTPVGFSSGDNIEFYEGYAPDGDAKVNIIAKGSLASVMMTTTSQCLTQRGWPASVDLLNLTEAQKLTLSDLGFKSMGLWSNPDKMAVIDLHDVLANLTQISGDNTSTFTFAVTDRYSKTAEPVTLSATVKEVSLTLSNPSALKYYDTSLTVDVAYNGADISKDVKIMYFNERGTWSQFTAVSYAAKSGVDNTYTATIFVPSGTDDITIKAQAISIETPNLVINRAVPDIAISLSENNVFATHATVSIVTASRGVSSAKLFLSDNGGVTYTRIWGTDSQVYNITGLKPSTTYYLRAEDDDCRTKPVAFTTEANPQLPHSSMRDWYQTSSGSHWELVFCGTEEQTVWGTNNIMTTSQGSDYAYCRISGTISTDDGYVGTGALLRTVGWGSGNTATGSVGSGVCKYIDAGLLHLGASRSVRPDGYKNSTWGTIGTADLNCGIPFTSRPSALEFYYKYSPKNSADKGYAEITVFDASGNIVATANTSLAATSSYTKASVALSYASGAAKAAKIYVKFLSTNDETYLKKNSSNITPPPFANLSRGTWMGAQLYIDEIALTY